MKDINIYLIRHGESEGNIIPNMIGQEPDTKLTEHGVNQTGRLGKRFLTHGISFDCIWSSTYLRAKTTAEVFSKIVRYEPEIVFTDALVEYNPGDWKGQSRSIIYENFKHMKDITHCHMGFVFPNGESYHQVARRASSFIEDNIIHNKEILKFAEDRDVNVACVSHGQTIKTILHYIMGYDQSFLWKIRLGNTSICHVVFNDKGWFLNSINDMGHLIKR